MANRKHCPKCDKSLSTTAFSKAVRAGDGLQGWCKRCMVGYKNEYRDAHGDSYNKLSNQRLRWDVLVHYSADPPFCSCCGDTTYEFLSIDHINGGGRQHRIANNWSKLYQLLKSAGLPPGYRVLCHNCNQAIGHYGFCPHQHPERSLRSRPADKRETARLSATQRVLDAGLLQLVIVRRWNDWWSRQGYRFRRCNATGVCSRNPELGLPLSLESLSGFTSFSRHSLTSGNHDASTNHHSRVRRRCYCCGRSAA